MRRALSTTILFAWSAATLSARAVNTLAEAYRTEGFRLYNQGRYLDADRVYRHAKEELVHERGYEKITLEEARILSEWGLVEEKLSLYFSKMDNERSLEFSKSAVEHLENALDAQERLLGTSSATCARTLDTLGEVRLEQHENDLAESVFNKALSIRRINGEGSSIDAGFELSRLAIISEDGKRYKEAITFSKQAIALYDAAFGRGNNASMQCALTQAGALYGAHQDEQAEAVASSTLDYWTKKKNRQLIDQTTSLLKLVRERLAVKAQSALVARSQNTTMDDPKLIPQITNWRKWSAKAGHPRDVDAANKMLEGMAPQLTKKNGTGR